VLTRSYVTKNRTCFRDAENFTSRFEAFYFQTEMTGDSFQQLVQIYSPLPQQGPLLPILVLLEMTPLSIH